MDDYPQATYVPSDPGAPYANRTRMDCETYVTAPISTNYTMNGTTSFACDDVVSQYKIEMAEFLDWNPSLNESSPCMMANHTQYCVQRSARVSKDITEYCVEMQTAPSGYDCGKFTADYGLDQDQFVLWNPNIGKSCENFEVGTSYCVEVKHFRQPGMFHYSEKCTGKMTNLREGITSNCNQFTAANDTNCKCPLY